MADEYDQGPPDDGSPSWLKTLQGYVKPLLPEPTPQANVDMKYWNPVLDEADVSKPQRALLEGISKHINGTPVHKEPGGWQMFGQALSGMANAGFMARAGAKPEAAQAVSQGITQDWQKQSEQALADQIGKHNAVGTMLIPGVATAVQQAQQRRIAEAQLAGHGIYDPVPGAGSGTRAPPAPPAGRPPATGAPPPAATAPSPPGGPPPAAAAAPPPGPASGLDEFEPPPPGQLQEPTMPGQPPAEQRTLRMPGGGSITFHDVQNLNKAKAALMEGASAVAGGASTPAGQQAGTGQILSTEQKITAIHDADLAAYRASPQYESYKSTNAATNKDMQELHKALRATGDNAAGALVSTKMQRVLLDKLKDLKVTTGAGQEWITWMRSMATGTPAEGLLNALGITDIREKAAAAQTLQKLATGNVFGEARDEGGGANIRMTQSIITKVLPMLTAQLSNVPGGNLLVNEVSQRKHQIELGVANAADKYALEYGGLDGNFQKWARDQYQKLDQEFLGKIDEVLGPGKTAEAAAKARSAPPAATPGTVPQAGTPEGKSAAAAIRALAAKEGIPLEQAALKYGAANKGAPAASPTSAPPVPAAPPPKPMVGRSSAASPQPGLLEAPARSSQRNQSVERERLRRLRELGGVGGYVP